MQWFTVSDQNRTRDPEWLRIFGINKDGEVFVPAAMAGGDMEDRSRSVLPGTPSQQSSTSIITTYRVIGLKQHFLKTAT